MATGTIQKYADGVDTGWINLSDDDYFTGGPLKIRKIGNIWQITNFSWLRPKNQIGVGGSHYLATIPADYRPSHVVVGMVYVNDNPYPLILMKIENGDVRIYNGSNAAIAANTPVIVNGILISD